MSGSVLRSLLSGSDVRGTAMEGHGEPVTLTGERAADIAAAYALWSERKGRPFRRIAVGADTRLSSPALKAEVIRALTGSVADVLDLGTASTPAMFSAIGDLDCDASIVITASHMPRHRNGLKFFLPERGLEQYEVAEVLDLAEAKQSLPIIEGSAREVDYMPEYAAHLVRMVRERLGGNSPLEGMKIAVDAGNGVGGFYAKLVLAPLGADISGSVYLEPDGSFPHHIPNPEEKEAMEAGRRAVLESSSDLGIVFDTDCDRAAIVDRTGLELNRNRLIALTAAVVLEKYPGATIVTDSVTSTGLTEFIEKHGGHHHRWKRGYRNVIDEALRLGSNGIDAPLAMETSGHSALRENRFLDDGAYLATLLIAEAARLKREGRDLSDLLSGLREPAESAEVRLPILAEDFAAYGATVTSTLLRLTEETPGWSVDTGNHEGIRVLTDRTHGDGWFLLRLSRHDPVMPLNFESDTPGGVRIMAQRLAPALSRFTELDNRPLRNVL